MTDGIPQNRIILLLLQDISSGYSFQTVADFIRAPKDKTIILRHDVDLLPQNALTMAKLEHGLGVVATYYFRAVPESWDEGVIREIAGMGVRKTEVRYQRTERRRDGETKRLRAGYFSMTMRLADPTRSFSNRDIAYRSR